MGSVNRVFLIGHLGAEAELRYTPGGAAVSRVRLATTETWNDKSGQKQERTDWHTVNIWGKQAEVLSPYLNKGKQVCVEGKIEYREVEKDGSKRVYTDIRADRVTLLGGATKTDQTHATADATDIPF